LYVNLKTDTTTDKSANLPALYHNILKRVKLILYWTSLSLSSYWPL